MGFSFYNNVAVAARVVQKELGAKKILVLDWYVAVISKPINLANFLMFTSKGCASRYETA